MKKTRNLAGQKFGKLTAIRLAYIDNGLSYWWCECECGVVKAYYVHNLLGGKSKSCAKGKCHSMYKRGYAGNASTRTTEYVIWDNMKRRCGDNPKASGWKYYGGRGIRVCERWMDFDNFLADMGARPSSNHSIDRIDYNGNYCPENCRWATHAEQGRNMKSNVWLELDGRRMILKDWAREIGITYVGIKSRLAHGWSVRKALTTPSRAKTPSKADYLVSA